MSEPVPESPSSIISYFVRSLERVLPDEEAAELAAFDEEVAASDGRGDLKRAWRCAQWALELAGEPDESFIQQRVGELQEAYRLLKDSIFGFQNGLGVVDGVGPGADVQVQWVDRSVAVAKEKAAVSGWQAVPWEGLLRELLSISPDHPA